MAALTSLSLLTVLVNGYHPLSEDGGVYVAGIEYLLDPALFPHDTAFVTAHLHYSLFAPIVAAVVHVTHLPLSWVLLLGYVFSLWLLLYAGLQILRRCTISPLAQLSGIALLGAWSTLPVAGTSLLLMDPYLTARSFTTPLSLLAIAYALDDWQLSAPMRKTLKSVTLCALYLIAAILLHPLMAVSALAIVILIRLLRQQRAQLWCSLFVGFAIVIAAALHNLSPPDAPSGIAASLSRYYWFLSQWQWYELCGLIGPIVILLLLLRSQQSDTLRQLCRAALVAGGTAILIALLFAHANSSNYLVARLQPLRVFLLLYAMMALLLGSLLSTAVVTRLRDSRPQRRRLATLLPLLVILASGIALFSAQRATYPASQHIELPWRPPTNPWSQAFLWISHNTPRSALFALDPDYITTPGEDAQTFRATAQRSALPDFSKDGGEASITPSLIGLWQQALAAQFATQSGTHLTARNTLSKQSDAERDAHLRPLGVTWIVLLANAHTSHPCAYNNGTVKVCQLAP